MSVIMSLCHNNLVTNYLSIIIFINLIQLKIQSVYPVTSMSKTLITDFTNVLQVTPLGKKCLGTTKGS